jgi:hypothetical protein
MDRPVGEANITVIIEPTEGMLEPIFIVSLRKIFPRMGAATFRPPDSGVKTDARLGKHIVEFERFSEVRTEDH